VLGYHAELGPVPGGFIGVDVFFVISGFLITGDHPQGSRPAAFLRWGSTARRVRRIFPALIVVLAATALIAGSFCCPTDFRCSARASRPELASYPICFNSRRSAISRPDAAENPLVHLWSLGIEEQFYIFWPPFLWLLAG